MQHIETLVRRRRHLHAVVLDLEATNQMDTTTAERLQQMMLRLRLKGVDLYLVRVFGNVRDVLTRSGFLDEMGPEHVWHSIAAGVKAARSAPPIVVAMPEGAGMPGDVADADLADAGVDDEPEPDEPENGVHGEHIASKHVPDEEPGEPHAGPHRAGRCRPCWSGGGGALPHDVVGVGDDPAEQRQQQRRRARCRASVRL